MNNTPHLPKIQQASNNKSRGKNSQTFSHLKEQYFDRSWKNWKVMKLKNFIFQARKVLEFNCRSWEVMGNKNYVID